MTHVLQQDEVTAATVATINRFNDAVNRRDVDAVMAAMTEDCIFENTWPSPDGTRYEGQAAVRTFWEEFLSASPQANFTTEEMIASGDRCTVTWVYRWGGESADAGHVRGIDLFRVRNGKVAEKFAYVKG